MLAVVYAPLVVVVAAASVVWAAPRRPWLIPVIVVVVVAVTFVAERRIPVVPAWNRRNGVRVDVAHAVVNESVTALGVLTVPLVAAAVPGWDVWPADAPLAVRVVVAVLVGAHLASPSMSLSKSSPAAFPCSTSSFSSPP